MVLKNLPTNGEFRENRKDLTFLDAKTHVNKNMYYKIIINVTRFSCPLLVIVPYGFCCANGLRAASPGVPKATVAGVVAVLVPAPAAALAFCLSIVQSNV